MEKIPGEPIVKKDSNDEQETVNLLVFMVHDIRIGIPANSIDHVVHMVSITPVPKAPAGITGIVNYHGEILPVFSLRAFFSLPDREIKSSDFLLIIRNSFTVAIIAEQIEGVFVPSKEIIRPDSIIPGIDGISGVYRCNDGLIVITSPEEFVKTEDVQNIRKLYESLTAL